MDILHAIILGIIEGLTEFLPVSSTGHMILASQILKLANTDFLKTFEVSIQLGSILAVVFVMRKKVPMNMDLYIKLAISFVPTGVIGFLLYKYIKDLFTAHTVGIMLIIGGLAFIIIELIFSMQRKLGHEVEKKFCIKDISYKDALIIGLSQSLAMIPGTSRSGSTIFCGLLLGLSRPLAAEFSFILAIPTMFAATGYDLFKNHALIDAHNGIALLVGGICAFFTAILAIKTFLKIVKKFSYSWFGIYRILLGIIVLYVLA